MEVFGGTTGELNERLGNSLGNLDFDLALFLTLLFFRGLGTLGDDRKRRLLAHLAGVEALLALGMQAHLELGA